MAQSSVLVSIPEQSPEVEVVPQTGTYDLACGCVGLLLSMASMFLVLGMGTLDVQSEINGGEPPEIVVFRVIDMVGFVIDMFVYTMIISWDRGLTLFSLRYYWLIKLPIWFILNLVTISLGYTSSDNVIFLLIMVYNYTNVVIYGSWWVRSLLGDRRRSFLGCPVRPRR